jgi:uncharacterized membrane protein YebE (DUF533 family)
MQHLANLGAIESMLIGRRNELVQTTSMVFNLALLGLVLSTFAYFLYVQYESNKDKVEEKRIPFKPTTWYSATRNVRDEEYGSLVSPSEVEARLGLPGFGY